MEVGDHCVELFQIIHNLSEMARLVEVPVLKSSMSAHPEGHAAEM